MPDSEHKIVLVLDLDDTLYKESSYVKSGVTEVCNYINSLYNKDLNPDDIIQLNNTSTDWIGHICHMANLPISVKESLLWIYRLHKPSISLDKKNKLCLEKLSCIAKLVILTDGRSITQRQKIFSLGLTHIPVYISEEYQSEKPDALRFKKIMKDIPGKKYAYVGDNPKKDFIAPNQLNWYTIGVMGDIFNIHSQDTNSAENSNPQYWIYHLEELLNIL